MKTKRILFQRLVFFILTMSLLFNIVFFSVDIFPVVKRKLSKSNYLINVNSQAVEKKIVTASYDMFVSTKIHMPYGKNVSFIEKVKNLGADEINRINYFPRAYLALGLVRYASKYDQKLLKKVISRFDNYYFNNTKLNFNYEYVDQVPLGLTALELFKLTKEIKYKLFADYIYNNLIESVVEVNDYSLILYRNYHSDFLVDTLGLVCPFLMEYGAYFKNTNAKALAESQLQFFMEYGLDQDTGLPFHAVDLNTNEGLGPNNWGRGMGWYMLALESVYLNYPINQDFFCHEDQNIKKTLFLNSLQKLKDIFIFTQFPGTSKEFDSSSTTMLMYGENQLLPGTYGKEKILNIFKPYIKENGILDFCSAEAFGVNKYSLEFGESEFAQGMLLMLLSTTSPKIL